jgi:cytochrome c oxidase subunit IV
MQNELIPDDMCNVWQNQGPGPAPPPLEEIHRKAGKLHSQIFWRNIRESVVSALLVPYFGYCAWTARLPLAQVGNGLMVAGLLYMVYQLHRKASSAAAPADLGWKSCVAFYRAELERQRDALLSVWKWYLGPLVPGLATILAGASIAGFHRSTLIGMVAILPAGLVALLFWGVGRLNRKAAGQLQKQIDALDALGR